MADDRSPTAEEFELKVMELCPGCGATMVEREGKLVCMDGCA